MAKNIKKIQHKKGKINTSATEIKSVNTGNEYPVFSFRHVCDNHCFLSEWQKDELLELLETFKKMESLTWNELVTNRHGGLDYRKETGLSKPLPAKVSPDVDVCRVKVCEVKRLWGYRVGNVFRVLWFDREHEIVPWHKVKRV